MTQWPPPGVKPYFCDDAVCIIHGDCREIVLKADGVAGVYVVMPMTG